MPMYTTHPHQEIPSVSQLHPMMVVIATVSILSLVLDGIMLYFLLGNSLQIGNSPNSDALGIKKALLSIEYDKIGGKENYELYNKANLLQFQDQLPQIKAFVEKGGGTTPEKSGVYSVSKLGSLAESLGLDMTKWQSCYDNKETLDIFSAQTLEAEKFGLTGTPGTIILNVKNGKYDTVTGAYPYQAFEEKINNLLKADGKTEKTLSQEEIGTLKEHLAIDGNREAEILVIEYSDMECPFCIKQYHETELSKKLHEQYSEKVAFGFKNNRGVNHPGTEAKAIAALCAQKVGGDETYIKYYNTILENSFNN